MILKSKKELQNFIDNSENSINYLISKLNENKVSVKNVDECYLKIDEIQKFYEDCFLVTDIETQNKLQEQRLRISRDLHDNIGAQLTFIISTIENLQFGFKKGCSTTLCTFVLGQVVNHFMNNGSKVYAMFLDCSKAFDLVSIS